MPKARVLAVMAIVLTCGALARPAYAQVQGAEIVIEWNQLLQPLLPVGPTNAQRQFSILHVAMFDAINSIERQYTPYHVRVRASHGGSPEAAAAQAAHDVMVALYPVNQATYDATLAADLTGIPPGRAQQGREVGHTVAQAILAWRQNDRWNVPFPAYVLPPFPGLWQPTPSAFGAAQFTQLPDALPFALITNTQYLPPPPPTLTSEKYAEDFNEVKLVGRVDSATRTPEQTLLARVFGGVVTNTTFIGVWNNVLRDVARQRGLSLIETARAYALLNVSLHDGLQTSFTSKFAYGLWRPVTAIRRADEDLNPATEPDPDWLPLLGTPPYPSYLGNAACLAAAAARALELVFGENDIPFSITWHLTNGEPDVTREFAGFFQLADAQRISRIHGGIHYRFDGEAALVACPKVSEFAFARYMVPR